MFPSFSRAVWIAVSSSQCRGCLQHGHHSDLTKFGAMSAHRSPKGLKTARKNNPMASFPKTRSANACIYVYIYIYTYTCAYVYIIPYHIISYHIIPYHIISYYVMSCHVMSCHVISCHIISPSRRITGISISHPIFSPLRRPPRPKISGASDRGLRLCHPLHCFHLLHQLGQCAGLGTRGEDDAKGGGADLGSVWNLV